MKIPEQVKDNLILEMITSFLSLFMFVGFGGCGVKLLFPYIGSWTSVGFVFVGAIIGMIANDLYHFYKDIKFYNECNEKQD